MPKLYRICSIIYRLILGLAIPALLAGNFLVAAAGHSKTISRKDYFLFAYLLSTVTLLTLYHNTDKERHTGKRILFFIVAALVLVSIVFELYSLYDIFFLCRCFTASDNIGTLLIFLFSVIATIVFAGIIREQKKSE
ncbi:hypothetical protein [Terrimonas pollutisoli]|uniref:hypothetical protein n=1 Tax=Terrimonas pollutisoli TaxID=3034147 RepID=UPI0023EB68B7|nr:hypothetical protein [Terrimonas sp. H1YJ31]